jgi:steroid 5-alpha reductase family enzyme
MIGLLLVEAAALLIYMSGWYLYGRHINRLDVVDTAWGGGYILSAIIAFIYRQNVRTELIGLLVLLWGLRLARHIYKRSGSRGPDPRYEELSAKWKKQHLWAHAYFSVFLVQGLIILIVAMPIAVAGGENKALNRWVGLIGVIGWAAGFIIESIADNQLRQFISSPSNKGKVLSKGLWHYSRHPNYFGELMQWWFLGLLAIGTSLSLIGLLGPLTLSGLIIFVSGIPSVEKRRLNNPAYQAYKKRTSALIPLATRSS